MDYDILAEFAVQLAKDCGAIMAEAFYKRDHNVVTKATDVDLVTETDKLIEKTIIEQVKVKYPNHKFIGEESSVDQPVILTNQIT